MKTTLAACLALAALAVLQPVSTGAQAPSTA
jgi:hypothetical protein